MFNNQFFTSSDFLIPLTGVIIFAILIWFALREFWCWYFKTNEFISLLKEIKESLEKGQRIEGLDKKMVDLRNAVNDMGKDLNQK